MVSTMSNSKKIPPLEKQRLKIIQTQGGDVSSIFNHQLNYDDFVNGVTERHGKIFGSQSFFSANEMDSTRSFHTTYIYYKEPIGADLVQDKGEDL
jgi:hypothetical protein